jgi:hypothetical protein
MSHARDEEQLVLSAFISEAEILNPHVAPSFAVIRNAVERFNESETFQLEPGAEAPPTPPASTPTQ